MKPMHRNALLVSIGIALGATLTVGTSVFADRAPAPQTGLPLAELQGFTEVFSRIKADYVEPVDDKKLLEYAIRGMLSGLDPHSNYLDQQEYKDLQVATTGQFGGLGIEVGMEDGFVKVISPIDDTPAYKAGVLAGDLIIRLDDTPVKGMTLNDAVNLMRGKPGTNIVLTIVREGAAKPMTITLTRDVIKVKSVKTKDLEPGYAYIRITSFQTQTGDQVLQAIDDFKKANGGSLKGLVLDLRNNPGGALGAAVAVADAFVDKGLVVYTEGRAKDAAIKFAATPGDVLNGAPIVVLVNGGSASASEIVAGALQDHHRAVLMGSRTFGKGSVQTIFPMSDNEVAVKLTTARYFTPAGRSIQAEGIEPDIKLASYTLTKAEENGPEMLKEANLTGHLANGNKPAGGEAASQDPAVAKGDKAGKAAGKAKAGDGETMDDYALHEALNLLRGMNILQARTAAK